MDTVNKHLLALKTLGLPVEHWDAVIIYLITTKLDKTTAREWEKLNSSRTAPELSDFFDFLQNRANYLQVLELNECSKPIADKNEAKGKYSTKALITNKSSSNTQSCNFCRGNHLIYSCERFLSLSISERYEQVKKLNLCLNCLCTGHSVKTCRLYGCKICKSKHSTLLHFNKNSAETSTTSNFENNNSGNMNENSKQVTQNLFIVDSKLKNSINTDSSNSSSSSINLATKSNENYVLLSTAVIYVFDKTGNRMSARVVLDSASQSCYITVQFCQKLGLDVLKTNISVTGLNGTSSYLNSKCQVEIGSTCSDFSSSIQCFVVDKITGNLPDFSFDTTSWKIPEGICLADPSFNVSGPVDMLIGANLFWNILCEGRISIGKNAPILQNTVFGYIVAGNVHSSTISNTQQSSQCFFLANNTSIKNNSSNDELQMFWSIEEPKQVVVRSEEDEICEDYFKSSTSRAGNGQFTVKIPWKENPSCLGESKSLAIKRFLNLESRFRKNPELKDSYSKFIHEYSNLGHMSLDSISDLEKSYFLPHHGVIRNESLTTRLRVVFDGSAPTRNGKSLNGIQHAGPAIQNDIIGILLRFRENKIAVASDISKMYRCVLLHSDDTPFQKIMWRDNYSDPILTYKLLTLTYGCASSAYLAMRCIQQLGYDFQNDYPEACEVILRDMYVDDLISSFSDETTAIKTCDQISRILGSASFNLRKWSSNSGEVLDHFRDDSDSLRVLDLGDQTFIKTLGVKWCSKSDVLGFSVEVVDFPDVLTKRLMLSSIAKLYDPLGLASCCTILAKIMIQGLWSLKLDWDSEVPTELCEKWKAFHSKLECLNHVQIPRFALVSNAVSIELHGFSDASIHAYCAVIYVRCTDPLGNITVKMLCAKTKVAPIKILTVPRLELCGCLLLVHLMKAVTDSVTFKFNSFYWCDSQIVLHWLHNSPSNLQVFVGNRVAEIQRLSCIENWNYVHTSENPADYGSRGIMPDQLEKCDLWFQGPAFLSTEFEKPKFRDLPTILEIPEVKKNVIVLTSVSSAQNDLCHIFEKFSQLDKLVRVVAYCRRFIATLRLKIASKGASIAVGPISSIEYYDAKLFLVKLAQEECFPCEISLLKDEKPLPSSNRLLSLTPFLDKNNLLRVGGRLKKSSLGYEGKHPLLLDKKHIFSKLIFVFEHKQLQHAGPQLLLASVRQQFWVIHGMSLAKETVKNCIRCFRFKPKPINMIMADLPEPRVNVSPIFSITGLDYAGPFTLKDRKGRGSKTYKAYICLFICFATKCVHLELISSLTTEAFLAGLRRFVSRRGKPTEIYSDNGSNFVGAQRELKELYQCLKNSHDLIVSSCANQGISWRFIPPNTPNFGGLWESNIKGVKFHLSRVIGETILTYEEFVTFLVQVEATLNSRPLYALSSDPNDYEPLSPSHFLIGRSMNTVPDPYFEEKIKINQLSRFQLIQQLIHGFWKQWSKLYLSQLQQKNKWRSSTGSIEVNDLVVLRNDNLPPCKWQLGRILEIHPGSDQVVRVATIKTMHGTFKRGVSKIYPLPLASSGF